jgi:8-oxo-dGTP diphosphatase
VNFIFVSICILKKKNKILVTKRVANKYFGEFWEFPGGKLEKKEDFKDAAKRELFEELGIRINIKNLKSLDILNHTYDKKNYIIMNLFHLNKWEGKIRNKDTKNYLWINKTGPFPNKFLEGGLLILKRLKNQHYKL